MTNLVGLITKIDRTASPSGPVYYQLDCWASESKLAQLRSTVRYLLEQRDPSADPCMQRSQHGETRWEKSSTQRRVLREAVVRDDGEERRVAAFPTRRHGNPRQWRQFGLGGEWFRYEGWAASMRILFFLFQNPKRTKVQHLNSVLN
jgi:hypothetical protein